MEWWAQSLSSLASVIVGAILGYCLARRGSSEERKVRQREQLQSAVRNFLAEVEANLKLAAEPWEGRLAPFVTDMWEVHKGYILALPNDLQDTLHRVYVEIQKANALFQLNLSLEYGKGYYNEAYKSQCSKIKGKAEETRKLLVNWLQQEGIKVAHDDRGEAKE